MSPAAKIVHLVLARDKKRDCVRNDSGHAAAAHRYTVVGAVACIALSTSSQRPLSILTPNYPLSFYFSLTSFSP